MNNQTPDITGLKPCPFCGGKGIAHRVPTGWRVSCAQCDCQPRPGFPSDDEGAAISVWNTRAALTGYEQGLRDAAEACEGEKGKWGEHPYVVATAESLRKHILSLIPKESDHG